MRNLFLVAAALGVAAKTNDLAFALALLARMEAEGTPRSAKAYNFALDLSKRRADGELGFRHHPTTPLPPHQPTTPPPHHPTTPPTHYPTTPAPAALRLIDAMRRDGVHPNNFSYSCAIFACADHAARGGGAAPQTPVVRAARCRWHTRAAGPRGRRAVGRVLFMLSLCFVMRLTVLVLGAG